MTVRPLAASDVEQAAGVIADAFHDDPLYVHLYPDPARRRRGLRIEYRAYVRRIYLPVGIAETTDKLDGVALWLAPDQVDSLGWREKLLFPMLLRAVGWRRF